MGIEKNVFIIFGEKYTEELVRDELLAEGYPYNFVFATSVKQDVAGFYMHNANEIWVFGDVEDDYNYKLAVELGRDIWRMG